MARWQFETIKMMLVMVALASMGYETLIQNVVFAVVVFVAADVYGWLNKKIYREE